MNAADRLIVALDNPTVAQAQSLVSNLGHAVSFYKIGWRLFLQGGLEFVHRVRGEGKEIFLDLKLNDIPATIETAVAELAGSVRFLTLFGDAATIRAALKGRGHEPMPQFLSVTLLSSTDEAQLCQDIGALLPETPGDVLDAFVLRRAHAAVHAGADGLIVSGESIRSVRHAVGPRPILVCPGIRPAGADAADQRRTRTPREAIHDGADYLVVGRPIWAHEDPAAAAAAIIAEIEAACD